MRRQQVGPKGVPFVTTSDGRTIRYPDPLIKVNDTVMVDISTGKIKDSIKFDSGKLALCVTNLMQFAQNYGGVVQIHCVCSKLIIVES